MIEFRIDRRSGTPTYLQIVEQTRQALVLGRLAVGDRLPTAREVVASTGINPNTVLKAYRELEHEGLVEARSGAGTFVVGTLARAESARLTQAGSGLADWLRDARSAGLERHEVEALMKSSLDQEFDNSDRNRAATPRTDTARIGPPPADVARADPRGEARGEA